MRTIRVLRDSVVRRIGEKVPGLRTCEAHDGNYDLDELTRVYKATPAALVVVLGVQDTTIEGGLGVANVRLGVAVLVADTKPLVRANNAIDLAEDVLRLARNEYWNDVLTVRKATNLKSENLYSGGVDKQGVSLWLVSWLQRVDLTETDMGELADFNQMNGDLGQAMPDAPLVGSNNQIQTEEEP
jgi:phage gp37-like protein